MLMAKQPSPYGIAWDISWLLWQNQCYAIILLKNITNDQRIQRKTATQRDFYGGGNLTRHSCASAADHSAYIYNSAYPFVKEIYRHCCIRTPCRICTHCCLSAGTPVQLKVQSYSPDWVNVHPHLILELSLNRDLSLWLVLTGATCLRCIAYAYWPKKTNASNMLEFTQSLLSAQMMITNYVF